MDKKKIIVVFGILYYMGGLGAGLVCLVQSQIAQKELTPIEIVQQNDTMETTMDAENDSITTQEIQKVETEKEVNNEEVEKDKTEQENTMQDANIIEQEVPKNYLAVVIDVGEKRLNVRKQPSMEGEIIGAMVLGQEAKVIEVGDEWHLIEVNDMEGYVSSMYIELVELPNEGTS